MSKLPQEHENIIDHQLISLCEYISEPIHNLGITPNMITTLSTIIGLGASYFLYHNKIPHFISCIILYYFGDCLDGHIARKYNQETKFGDFYDHARDLLVFTILFYISYKKYKTVICHKIIIAMIIMFFILQIHVGCQQKIFDKDNIESLSALKKLCTYDDMIVYTRHFGCGTFMTFTVIMILFMHYKLTK